MSINKVTYLHQFIPNNMWTSDNNLISRFYFNDTLEVTRFLNTLKIDTTYVVTFEFVYSWLLYEEDSPVILLSKPILITKNSNPEIVAKFIMERITLACESYYLECDMMDKLEGPGVIVKYTEISIF